MFAGFIKRYMAVLLSLFLAIFIHMLVYWPRVGVFPNFVDSLVRGSDEHLRVASRACGGRAMHKVHVHSCHSKLVSWNAVFLLQRWGRARRNRHVSDHRKKGHWTAATSFAPDTLLFAGLMNCDMTVLLRPFLGGSRAHPGYLATDILICTVSLNHLLAGPMCTPRLRSGPVATGARTGHMHTHATPNWWFGTQYFSRRR